jgi:UDP-N-acetyl-D-glucosamine dehydrogenase
MIEPGDASTANRTRERVVVVGQGYVGLPIAMQAVEAGFAVVGYDTDIQRIVGLASGLSYVEDISDATLRAAMASQRYQPTSEIADCKDFDVIVITVPTPLREGAPDLSFIEDSARAIAPLVRPGATVILESTTYPGTTEELLAPILEAGSGLTAGGDFHLGYSPERIDPGNPTWTLLNTPKVVSGVTPPSLDAVRAFYDCIVEETVPVSGTRVAEMTKLLENTFRHVNIALVNELAMFAGELGVDVWEAIAAASTKPFGFMPFTPGPGVGGHCLPVDPSYLSWKVKQTLGTSFRFVELANEVNDHMPDYVTLRVSKSLNDIRKAVNGSAILVLGLAYKRNTSDARESPVPVICEQLVALGAQVRVADPLVPHNRFPPSVSRVAVTEAELRSAELVLIATDHDQFDWDLVQSASRRILDTRNRLPAAANVEHL